MAAKNNGMRKILILFILLPSLLYAQKGRSVDTSYIKSCIRYTNYYSFISFDKNIVEWYDSSAIFPFFKKLESSGSHKVSILHVGDSHLQSDIGAGVTRDFLQRVFGLAGRGMVFPYQAAKTHSTYDYFAQYSGVWVSSKNVELKPKLNLGISGITLYTNDPNASLTLIFRKHYLSIRENFRKLRIFCHRSPESFHLEVKPSGYSSWIDLNASNSDSLPFIESILPLAPDTLYMRIRKTDSLQKYFELHGLSIESIDDNGLLYNSVGINGAGYRSFFSQNMMERQLKSIQPDMVIFDLGANDIARGNFNADYVYNNLKRAIAFLRSINPNVCILLPNIQDIFLRRVNVVNGLYYSALTRKIAKEFNIAFYDYYQISGGRYSMNWWAKNGLSQRDKTHLSFKGYQLKGELYANAILNSYLEYLKHRPNQFVRDSVSFDSLTVAKSIVNKASIYDAKVDSKDKIQDYKNVDYGSPNPQDAGASVVHIVKSGETLGAIAKKYGVSVSTIQLNNKLKGTSIYPGQRLIIKGTVKKNYSSTNSDNSNATSNNTVPIKNATIHVVASGETLSSIAKKYGVSVSDLKSWNALNSDNLSIGQKLKVAKSGAQTTTKPNSSTSSTTKPNSSATSGKGRVTYSTHVVQKGESLWSIANKYKISVEEVKKANKMSSDKLQPGDKLLIPKK